MLDIMNDLILRMNKEFGTVNRTITRLAKVNGEGDFIVELYTPSIDGALEIENLFRIVFNDEDVIIWTNDQKHIVTMKYKNDDMLYKAIYGVMYVL